jgi:hypothetical protein
MLIRRKAAIQNWWRGLRGRRWDAFISKRGSRREVRIFGWPQGGLGILCRGTDARMGLKGGGGGGLFKTAGRWALHASRPGSAEGSTQPKLL